MKTDRDEDRKDLRDIKKQQKEELKKSDDEMVDWKSAKEISKNKEGNNNV